MSDSWDEGVPSASSRVLGGVFVLCRCILIIRGSVVQIGIFSYIHEALGDTHQMAWSESTLIQFSMTMITLFSVAIALFKDIPDVSGDRKHNVISFSVRMGEQTIFTFCVGLLLVTYAYAGRPDALGVLPCRPPGESQALISLGHMQSHTL